VKEAAVFVAVKKEDGAWDLFDRLSSSDQNTWCQVGLGIQLNQLSQNATIRTAQPWVILCFGGLDHDATDSILASAGSWLDYDHEVVAALRSWRERPGGSRAAPAASPEQTEEKPAPPRCGFCPEEGLYPEHYSHCGQHGAAAEAHAGRLKTGGLVDGPESRDESRRFAEAQRVQLEILQAQLIGFRTQNDRAKGAQLAISHRPSPPEEIPAVGTTPHYEWP
jgi:hypothetical protein